MKNKKLLIATIIFFLAINTMYYWYWKLGVYAFPIPFVIIIIYLVFVIALLRQLYLSIKEKFVCKSRLLVIGVLTFVLVSAFLKPTGLIDFEKFEGNDVLVAEREGAANCYSFLKLKDDFTFRKRSICFGASEIKGKFHLQNDTIYFDDVKYGVDETIYYKYAIIEPSKQDGSCLTIYESFTDTTGYKLWITKNELDKLRSKKPKR